MWIQAARILLQVLAGVGVGTVVSKIPDGNVKKVAVNQGVKDYGTLKAVAISAISVFATVKLFKILKIR